MAFSIILLTVVSLTTNIFASQLNYPNEFPKSIPRVSTSQIPPGRPPIEKRLFTSQAVEDTIERVGRIIKDENIRQIFTNCLPNTLDTTVYFHRKRNATQPLAYTYIITGDIKAMWLRDSTCQVLPYIPLARNDADLLDLILGIINTQAEMINLYPYGNAYFPLKSWNSGIIIEPSKWSINDSVYPPYKKDQVFEAKYELDSLALFLYLSTQFYDQTGDSSFLKNHHWLKAIQLILTTLRDQQGGTLEVIKKPPYTFTRPTITQSETTNLYGIGNPVKRCGLIRSFFRPSDDSTIFQFLIPSNALTVVGLEGVARVLDDQKLFPLLAANLKQLAGEVRLAIEEFGIIQHPQFGPVYAYEVDGFGSYLLMDDGNFPSLMSLPKFGYLRRDDPIYLNTRKYILDPNFNPYFATGPFPGIGSPHTGLQRPWCMGQAIQAMTSTNETEIIFLLGLLRDSTAGTGFMHESYKVDDPFDFTRSWFAMANSIFGDLILQIEREFPHLLINLNWSSSSTGFFEPRTQKSDDKGPTTRFGRLYNIL